MAIRRSHLLTFCLVLSVAAWNVHAVTEQAQKSSPAHGIEANLKESGNMLLSSILGDNADGIVALWSESGVAIGIDGPILPKQEIRREFRTKSRNFCLFFSTHCLRKQAGFERKDCYKDLLLGASRKEITYRTNRDGKSLVGEMIVDLKGPGDTPNAANPLEFDFLYEKGHWKLVSLPAI